jgi:hypothetical protein
MCITYNKQTQTPTRLFRMNLKYATLFGIAALLFAVAAPMYRVMAWVCLWPALSFGAVGAGYAGIGPRIFGKRRVGTMAWANSVILAPFLLYTWTVWHLVRLVTREPPANTLGEDLIIGRRLLGHELPGDIRRIIDLTAEFPEPLALRGHPGYRCFPMLDASTPDPDQLLSLVEEISRGTGKLFIHCAQGHGRTGLLTACLLMASAKASDTDESLELIQRVRPLARVSSFQRAFLRQIEPKLCQREICAAQ